MHIDVAEGLKAINPKLFEEVRARYKTAKGHSRLTEACVTRWGAVGEGGSQLAVRLPEYAVAVCFTFAEGLDQNIVKVVLSIWREDGFRHENLIHMPPKPGKLLYRLMDPGFIFGTHLTAFLQKFVHRVVLGASSYNKESSAHLIGGVGSVVRRVYHFLTRLMWVVLPVDEFFSKISARQKQYCTEYCTEKRLLRISAMLLSAPGVLCKSSKGGKNPWNIFYQLQWKGLVKSKPGPGLLMLNPRATRSAGGGKTSALELCYGPCYRPDMEGGIGELCTIMHKLSLQKFDDQRNFLPKGTIRSVCSGPQSLPYERVKVMVKAVFVQATAAAVALMKKYEPVLSDPHLFLAAIGLMGEVPVLSKNGKTSSYFVANRDSLANAACFQGQMNEIEQGYASLLGPGEKLGEYFHGPMRTLSLSPACRQELVDFRRADSVRLPSTLSGETGSYHVGEDHKNGTFKFRPRPVSAFPRLTELSLKCAAMPKTQNRIEGGFSLDSIAFCSNRRNQGPEMWSAILRKLNHKTFHLQKDLAKESFIQRFAECIEFRRDHKTLLQKCYAPDTALAEKKYAARRREDLPQYVQRGGAYSVTNICDGTDSLKILQSRNRNGGQEQNSRYRDCEQVEPLGESESLHPKPKRRLSQKKLAKPSLEAPSEWTLSSLNKEKIDDLRDLCATQGITVVPAGGRRAVKSDYIAAILEDQGRQRETSHAQFAAPEAIQVESSNSQDLAEVNDIPLAEVDLPPADVIDQSGMDHDDQLVVLEENLGHINSTLSPPSDEAGVPVACGLSGDDRLARPGPATDDEAYDLEELDSFILDCMENNVDPWSGDSNSEAMKLFDREMSAPSADTDFLSESDSEDEASSIVFAPRPDSEDQASSRTVVSPPELNSEDQASSRQPKGVPALQKKTPSVWNLESTASLASARNWRPSNIISTSAFSSRSRPDCIHGEAIRSVTLQRSDGQQFTVKDSGCLFYILRTPLAGIEMVKISAIFHPKEHSKGDQMQVFIEYCRVLKSSEAALVCDRADDLTQLIKSAEGKSFLSTSVGSKQIELQLKERREQKKMELYHWGDVFFKANAANLVGAVYWVSRGNESDRANNAQFQKDVLKGISDKIPVTSLQAMDYVVVGSSFSDSRLREFS